MLKKIKRLIKICRIKGQNKNVTFMPESDIGSSSEFEGLNKIGINSWFEGKMGYGSYVGNNCIIKGKIGRFCSIGHNVTVLTGTHPAHCFVSTNPLFYSLGKQNGATWVKQQKFQETIYADLEHRFGIIIGNDVWIGYNATIMGGVNVGDGAIVAAGALVKDDIKPYSIVAGQPAKEIGKRFSDDQIAWLIDYQWWNKPIDWIRDNAELFDNVDSFISYMEGENCCDNRIVSSYYNRVDLGKTKI